MLFMITTAALAQTNEVLWYHGNSGAETGSTGFAQHIGTLGGTVDITDTWGTQPLSDYRFVIIARPTQDFDTAQIADLQAYVDSFGILVLLGDSETGATQAGIDAMNHLATSLSLDMQLVSSNYVTPGNACTEGEVQNTNSFVNVATPIGFDSLGDIEVGGNATVLETYSVFVQEIGQTLTFTMLAHEGLVLMSSDFANFTNAPCTIAAKEAMWGNLWGMYCDRDQDGAQAPECGGYDCDDQDPDQGSAFEWADVDGDGFGDFGSPAPCLPDAVDNSDDCDDHDPNVNPDAIETCDSVDNNCDLVIDADAADATNWYVDFDGDGFGRDSTPELACDQPDDKVDNADDCDDGRDTVNPDAAEVCGNNEDDDCDGTVNEGCPTGGNPTGPSDTGGNDKPCSTSSGGMFGLLGMMITGLGLAARRERR